MYNEKLWKAQKTVHSKPQLLNGSSFLFSLYKRSRDGSHWMLTVFLPLSFVATALCESSNWSSTKSEGGVRQQAGTLTGRLTILVRQTVSHVFTEET